MRRVMIMNKKHGAWSKNEKIFLGLLAPILVLFFCFNTLPLIKGFYYGLTNFRGYGSYDFVGTLQKFSRIPVWVTHICLHLNMRWL